MGKLDLYHAARPAIRTGDAIAWQSDGIVGHIIQWWTASRLNHISIAIRFHEYDQDRVYILEELEHGAVLYPLSRRLEEHAGRAWVYPLAGELDAVRKPMASWALSIQGTRYDYPGLVRNALGRVSLDARRMFCSEYFWISLKTGIDQARNEPGLRMYKRIMAKLHGKAPRPSDFITMQKCGLFGHDVRIV